MATPPGFTIDGAGISVMFVSGRQDLFGWHNAEYVIGWKNVMKLILTVFETYHRMEDIERILLKMLKSWAKDGWMGRGKELPISLDISEEDFLPLDIKQIKISFGDDLNTVLRFYVKRQNMKKKSRSLMEITLENLSFLVDKSETTETLELPRNLNEALKDEIENCWKTRHIVDAMNNKKTSNIDRVHAWKTKYFDMS